MMLLFIFVLLIIPINSLNSPFNRFRRQANGCGSDILNIDKFLQEIGEDILIVCCNEHDLCYDTCGQKKLTCDKIFLNCMIKICQQLSSLSNINRCENDAKILFWIVIFGGQSAYQQAQQQHQCVLSKQITNNTLIQTVKEE